jgi:hypothetical protein
MPCSALPWGQGRARFFLWVIIRAGQGKKSCPVTVSGMCECQHWHNELPLTWGEFFNHFLDTEKSHSTRSDLILYALHFKVNRRLEKREEWFDVQSYTLIKYFYIIVTLILSMSILDQNFRLIMLFFCAFAYNSTCVIPWSNSPARKRPVPGNSGDFVEAIFRPENFRIFSNAFLPVPAGSGGRNHRPGLWHYMSSTWIYVTLRKH